MNGIRKRFDRDGELIEEILFKEGNAITKTNYDLNDSLVWIRKPLDSNVVWTEVFTFGGAMIASGHEKIVNPGNLLWFQNIELTALNTISISARAGSSANVINGNNDLNFSGHFDSRNLYNTPPLVEYNKEGDWIYYKEYARSNGGKSLNSVKDMLSRNYSHFGNELFKSIEMFDNVKINSGYDSIRVVYANDILKNFYGYGNVDYAHLQIRYYDNSESGASYLLSRLSFTPRIKEIGQYNRAHQKTGVWKHYDESSALYKTEYYIIPRKEDDEVSSLQGRN